MVCAVKKIEEETFFLSEIILKNNTLLYFDFNLNLSQKKVISFLIKKIFHKKKISQKVSLSLSFLKEILGNVEQEDDLKVENITKTMVGHVIKIHYLDSEKIIFSTLLKSVVYDYEMENVTIEISDKFLLLLKKIKKNIKVSRFLNNEF